MDLRARTGSILARGDGMNFGAMQRRTEPGALPLRRTEPGALPGKAWGRLATWRVPGAAVAEHAEMRALPRGADRGEASALPATGRDSLIVMRTEPAGLVVIRAEPVGSRGNSRSAASNAPDRAGRREAAEAEAAPDAGSRDCTVCAGWLATR